MTALALALAMGATPTGSPPPPWYQPWRLVTLPALHVGLRPALFVDNETADGSWEIGAGATLQVTLDVL